MRSYMNNRQDKNYTFFLSQLEKLIKDPEKNGKYVVIKDQKFDSFHPTFEAALQHASKKWKPGDYSVQQVINEDEIVNYLSCAV